MLVDSEFPEKQIVLRTQPQRLPNGGQIALQIAAQNIDSSTRRGNHPSQNRHGCCFASAVVTQESGDVAFVDVQGDTLHRLNRRTSNTTWIGLFKVSDHDAHFFHLILTLGKRTLKILNIGLFSILN